MRKEKRRSKRTLSENLIAFSCFRRDEKIPFDHSMGKTVDIGDGGMMLHLYKEVQTGTLLDVEIGLENEVVAATLEILRLRPASSNGDGYFASAKIVYIDHRDYQKITAPAAFRPVKMAGNQ